MTTKLTDPASRHLAVMLEGYEKGLEGVTQFVKDTSEQVETAKGQRQEILDNIAELKGLLGLTDEEEKETDEKDEE